MQSACCSDYPKCLVPIGLLTLVSISQKPTATTMLPTLRSCQLYARKIACRCGIRASLCLTSTRKLYYRKHDRAMRFLLCNSDSMHDPAIKVRSSDVNKGAWQMPCRNYGLRPGLFLVSLKFLHVPLGVGGWPLGYEERRCWVNCLRN